MFIGDYTLKAVEDFSYLGFIISSNLSLDTELKKRTGQAAAVLALLRKRIWDNTMLTISNKMKVYQACVLSTLLYSRPGPSTPTKTFHLRCFRRILGITWQDCVPNKDVVAQAGLPSMFALLNQRRLGWLGHVKRMKDGQIPKEILYSNLTTGTRPVGRLSLRFKVEGRQYQPYKLGSYSCRPKSLEAC